MKKIFLTLALIFSLSACAVTHTPVMHTIELKDMDYSNINNLKEGESCSLSVLGLIGPFGDMKLTNYDYNYQNYILAQRYCIRVYGY